MSQQKGPPSPAHSNHAEDTLIEHQSQPSITTNSPPDIDITEARAIEAARLINRTQGHFTDYEWRALKAEVASWASEEWEQMDLAWKKSMIREVIQDAKKMELIRETLFSMHIRVARVDEIICTIAGAANERIVRERIDWRDRREREIECESRGQDSEDNS